MSGILSRCWNSRIEGSTQSSSRTPTGSELRLKLQFRDYLIRLFTMLIKILDPYLLKSPFSKLGNFQTELAILFSPLIAIKKFIWNQRFKRRCEIPLSLKIIGLGHINDLCLVVWNELIKYKTSRSFLDHISEIILS